MIAENSSGLHKSGFSLIQPGLAALILLLFVATALQAVEPADSAYEQRTGQPINGTDNLPMQRPQQEPTPELEIFQSMVQVSATVPVAARSSGEYGTRRSGSGVVLDSMGLIATIGYLVAEADHVEITFANGRIASATVIAFDDHTGLALLRADSDIATVPVSLGHSAELEKKQKLMVLGGDGRESAQSVSIGKIEKFAGGWGYVLDDAIHTHPPNTHFGGSALVTEKGELVGIGALVSIDIDIDPKIRIPGNVFVPVDELTSRLGQLIVTGKQKQPRAWLGVVARQTKQGLVVRRVIDGGPASASGITKGDKIVAVNQQAIKNTADFFEKVWQSTAPGEVVHLLLLRGERYANVPVETISPYDWFNFDRSVPQLSELDD